MLLCILWPSPPPPPPLCVDSILHPPSSSSSTVFYEANQFNAPLGSWDVSRVTDMRESEYIRVCDLVHHQSPMCNIMLCTVFLMNT